MIPVNFLNKLQKNKDLSSFLENTNDFEILIKRLNAGEIKRIAFEYSELLNFPLNEETNKDSISNNDEIDRIICFTLVKNDLDNKNLAKLKKIKFYIDDLNENIIRILQN